MVGVDRHEGGGGVGGGEVFFEGGGEELALFFGVGFGFGVGVAFEAGEAFFECVMCELCDAACPELIAPAHVGLFSRRVTAHFHLRPPNLIHRLEELRQAKSGTTQEEKNE